VVGGAFLWAGVWGIVAVVVLLRVDGALPGWVAALLVGVVVAGLGYVLLQRGLEALKHADLTPHRTVDSLKEDSQWAKEQMR